MTFFLTEGQSSVIIIRYTIKATPHKDHLTILPLTSTLLYFAKVGDFMTKEEYLDFCGSIAGATYDQPFNEDFQSTALRHWDTKKWFGLLMLHNDRWIVNLKLKPEEVLFYRDIYKGVTEAYHMNKVHWITLYLDSDVPTEEIEDLTLRSFELTKRKDKKKTKKRKEAL